MRMKKLRRPGLGAKAARGLGQVRERAFALRFPATCLAMLTLLGGCSTFRYNCEQYPCPAACYGSSYYDPDFRYCRALPGPGATPYYDDPDGYAYSRW